MAICQGPIAKKVTRETILFQFIDIKGTKKVFTLLLIQTTCSLINCNIFKISDFYS